MSSRTRPVSSQRCTFRLLKLLAMAGVIKGYRGCPSGKNSKTEYRRYLEDYLRRSIEEEASARITAAVAVNQHSGIIQVKSVAQGHAYTAPSRRLTKNRPIPAYDTRRARRLLQAPAQSFSSLISTFRKSHGELSDCSEIEPPSISRLPPAASIKALASPSLGSYCGRS